MIICAIDTIVNNDNYHEFLYNLLELLLQDCNVFVDFFVKLSSIKLKSILVADIIVRHSAVLNLISLNKLC